MSNPIATVVIVTRNRKAEVLRALRSCFQQNYSPMEVLVFDDASEDGTSDAISEHYPEVRLFREAHPRGYIVLRNRGFREAKGEFIFSLDDDAFYTNPGTIEPVIRAFELDPNVAAIAMPYAEPGRIDQGIMSKPSSDLAELRTFIGCAHAVRKQAVLREGGYREFLVHQGEERDLCIRLLERGYRIIYANSPLVVHAVSPIRDHHRIERYAIRNTLLFDVLNVPFPACAVDLLVHGFRLLAWMPGWPMTVYRAWYLLCALGSCLKYVLRRHPVTYETYRKFRSLPSHGPEAWRPEFALAAEAIRA